MITRTPGRTGRASRSTSWCATASSPRSGGLSGGDETLDADGLVLLPGFVDLHTHLREPGGEESETIATGSAAAALGGFTAVFAMANTDPVVDTDVVALHVRRRGAEVGLVDVHPVGAVTVGPARRAHGRAGHDGPLGRAGADVLRRRPLRARSADHAQGAGVRDRARRRHRPARRGPPAHRRARRRTRAKWRRGWGSRAGPPPPRRRSWPATARWPGRPGPGCTSATSPARTPSRCCGRPRRRACG